MLPLCLRPSLLVSNSSQILRRHLSNLSFHANLCSRTTHSGSEWENLCGGSTYSQGIQRAFQHDLWITFPGRRDVDNRLSNKFRNPPYSVGFYRTSVCSSLAGLPSAKKTINFAALFGIRNSRGRIMRTIALTALFAFTLILSTTTARALIFPSSDDDCVTLNGRVDLCYLECARQRPLPQDFWSRVFAWTDSAMRQKAARLRAHYATCPGGGWDGNSCLTLRTVLERFCRSSQHTERLCREFVETVSP